MERGAGGVGLCASSLRMALLYLPKQSWTRRDVMKAMEDPGWKSKRVPGAYIAGDLVENQKCILLCGTCKHGFDWKKHHYYSYAKHDHVYGTGRCDKCKQETNKLFIYMHESLLGQAGIMRQDTQRYRQKHAMIVG